MHRKNAPFILNEEGSLTFSSQDGNNLGICFPEYFSEQTLKKIREENPWLLDREVIKIGSGRRSLFIKTIVPGSPKSSDPAWRTSISLDHSWGAYIDELLYSYLMIDAFPSIESVKRKGGYGEIKTKSGVLLDYFCLEESEGFRIQFQPLSFAPLPKGVYAFDAYNILLEEGKEYINRLDYIDTKKYADDLWIQQNAQFTTNGDSKDQKRLAFFIKNSIPLELAPKNIDNFLICWPEYFTKQTLDKIAEENSWLFDQVVKERGLLFKKKTVEVRIPNSLKSLKPERLAPKINNPKWSAYVKELLYGYLIQDAFPSVQKIDIEDQTNLIRTQCGSKFTLQFQNEGFVVTYINHTWSEAAKIKGKAAYNLLRKEANEYSNSIEYFDTSKYIKKLEKSSYKKMF